MSEFEAYRGLFVAESRENHENLVKNLLLLEKGSDQNAIDEIFRSIHTIKGASASMGFSHMEHLCHTMEDVFQLIRIGSADISPDLGSLLLLCTDVLEQMMDDVESGRDSSSINPDEQVNSLRQWIEQHSDKKTKTKQKKKKQKKKKQNPVDQTPAKPLIESLSSSEEENCPEYEMTITVAADCTMKDVRAMLVLGNLDALGTLLSVTPTRETIDEGPFDGLFHLRIASDAGEEAIKTAASGTDIAKIEIRPVQDQESVAPDTCTDGTKPVNAEKNPSLLADKTREIKNLRVDIHQLDHIMNRVEDLVINRGRLKQIAEHHKIKEMDEAIGMVDRSVSELQNLMMIIRMIPLNQIFNRFPRVVRDVAQHDRKEVDFIIEGGETELDRSVMDGLNDPLLHLIRNAVNHGIESPDIREKAGKPRKGTVKISAHRDRDNVIIELIDDGAGINIDRVKEKAIEKGLITREVADTFTKDQAIDLLFHPGFSTAEKISDISGRGVGLDVVKRSIESLKGTIRVETTLGKGTRFELLLPPTMAIVDVMIVSVNGKRLGIPISSIVEVANFQRAATHRIGNGEAILLRDEVLQILWLDEMVGKANASEILIVVQYQKRKCCIPVDVVEGKQEVVVKPLSTFIGNTPGVCGVTILGDGGVVPVLDVNTMI